MKARFRIAATGTPVENSLKDIWSIFDFIQPGLLDPLNSFAKLYQRPIEAKTACQREKLDELRDILKPQILRRVKTEILHDLPSKTLDGRCRTLAMSDEQLRLYQQAVTSTKSMSFETSSERSMATIQTLQYLRRICCDPREPGEYASASMPFEDYRQIAPKFDWLVSTLEAIRKRDEKVIVFLESRDIQRQIKLYLDAHFRLNISIVNGETSNALGSEVNRQGLIDIYQATQGFNVVILSPLAAGVGLNIQEANHVVHYMRHWNPAREDQATDRAYRIGQERDVTVYVPIVCGGPDWSSFDQVLDELLEYKRVLAQDMYNGSEDVVPADLAGVLDVFEASL